MKQFAALFALLDATPKTIAKTAALADYFCCAPEQDRLWTIALLSGRRPKRAATGTELRRWAAERADLPPWLIDEAYTVVGDLAETISLILPPPQTTQTPQDRSLTHWICVLIALGGQSPDTRRAGVLAAWDALDATDRFLFNKLITGGFRMGVSRGLMTRALAQATGGDANVIAHRLMGDWTPDSVRFADLTAPLTADGPAADGPDLGTRPYPFALATALECPPDTLGPPGDWRAEWKWDGIRGQIVARPSAFAIWSRGEELMTDRFPEFAPLADHLPPGTVIDGEILVWGDDAPRPFAALQQRIGRKTIPKKLLTQAPVRMLAYDLLEENGHDLRGLPFNDRRTRLESLLAALPNGLPLRPSPCLCFATWEDLAHQRQSARDRGTEGVMLKRGNSAYHIGRKRGHWWKWKLDPFSIDAVMIYAQAGHGKRATLYTDFTFALRDGPDLVPFAKAYSGLTDAEFRAITAWVRQNTVERFGPVRRVVPELVFEIGFEGIQASPRHKSGLALRFPRMLRWRRDKTASEIDSIETLRAILAAPKAD